MKESLLSNPWALWLLLALFSGVLEVVIPYFTFSFISVAALCAMVAALRGDITVQIFTFALALIATLLFIRPRLLARLHRVHKMPSRSQALVGLHGKVTEPIDLALGTGRVYVDRQDWAARSDTPVAAGKSVVIEGHDGIVLIVKEI